MGKYELFKDGFGILKRARKWFEFDKKRKKALELKKCMRCEHSAYWLKDEQGNTTDGPFCTNCFDNEYTQRRLVKGGKPDGQVGRPWAWVQCPKCNIPFRSEQVGVYLNTH